MTVDLATLNTLFDLGPEESLRAVIRKARSISPSLAQLPISVAVTAGVPLGSGSRDELRRARVRCRCYAELADRMAAAVPIRVIKGPALAGYYPAGIMRPVGDLDVVVASQEDLWRAARVVAATVPVEHIDLSLLLHEGQHHVQLGLSWSSEDPMLDRDARVEIGTLAFVGDFTAVAPRQFLPADQVQANLLSLAEERFQRAFTAKDVLDVAFLLAAADIDVAVTVALAVRYLLAPELAELVDRARAHQELPRQRVLEALARALAEPAAKERDRRAAVSPAALSDGVPAGAESENVATTLASGLPAYGMSLQRLPMACRRHWVRARRRDVGDCPLLLTPLGDYLLVTEELVAPASYAAAVAALNRIGERS